VQREAQPLADELLDLAAMTRHVAGTVNEPTIRCRLRQIADELTALATQGIRRSG
jgi:hypothetical protein